MKNFNKVLSFNTVIFFIVLSFIYSSFLVEAVENVSEKIGMEEGDYVYTILSDNSIQITRYKGNAETLRIPNEIDGIKVTEIYHYAMLNCTNLKEIYIPENIRHISALSFANCPNIESINVEENNSFYSSKDGVLFNKIFDKIIIFPNAKGTSYVIPESVTCIGSLAFDDCVNLQSVTISNSVNNIESSAFAGCKNLSNLNLSQSVKTIGRDAFLNCYSLSKVLIPTSVETIEEYAFGYYYNADNYAICRISDFTIYCEERGTEAERYSQEYGIKFLQIVNFPTESTKPIEKYMLGDVDGDGAVKIKDATLIQKYDVDLIGFSELQLKASDVNINGRINVIDSTIIQKFLTGVEIEYSVGEMMLY